MSSASSEEEDDFAYTGSHLVETKRFPIHDCCEFGDADALRRLIFVPQEDSDDDDPHHDDSSSSSSSSDENDSTAAAHAAAIGHSPQPIRPTVGVVSNGKEDGTKSAETVDKDETAVGVTATEVTEVEEHGQGKENDSKEVPEVDEDKATQSAGNALQSIEGNSESDGQKAQETGAEEESRKADSATHHEAVSREVVDEVDKAKISGDEQASNEKPKKKQKFYCPYNLNERDGDENIALHIAIHSRKLEHVKMLLEAGSSVHKKSDGSAPIHTAISIGAVPQHEKFCYDCVLLLHQNDADLQAKDDAMHTPLYLACKFNLPQVVSFLLSTEAGASTLNTKADRSGGRPLHAVARFDFASKSSVRRSGNTSGGHIRQVPHHHPDGTVVNSMHLIPGFPGKPDGNAAQQMAASDASKKLALPSGEALLAQLLLRCPGIEVDALNTVGQTPLHIGCLRGNWPVVRLLLQAGANPQLADRRGFTAGQLAHKRGMPIPNDLLDVVGGPPSSGTVAPPRDLIIDPDRSTLMLTHELCTLHRSCPPIKRDPHAEPPPENVRRLHVLIDEETGILRCGEFEGCVWDRETRRAAMLDVLKCHEYSYVETISQMCSSIPDHPSAIAHLDADTAISRWSFEAALRAAGSVCEAVDKVVSGDYRNAFCPVRPPGHHAGPRGIVRCANDPEGGSHGFCLLNNVAIGAAYARAMYRNEGIRKIAIIDFDVHHGNGTEEIIRQLVPSVHKGSIRTPFALGEIVSTSYRPWLDETDINDVFFASTHGYGPRGLDFADVPGQGGWFYPASGNTHTSDAIINPSLVETPNLTDFLLSQTWTRMGEDARANCCKIINCGLGIPERDAIPGMQRLEVRDTYRQKILPHLRDFDPDIIFISAGFDGHKKDTMNFGYVGMVEDDYEWITEQLVKIANTCCNGRIVSVLEGGYKIHGGIVSPFARSVASHVRALVDGGRSRELYDIRDGEWESQFERHLVDERERRRQQKLEKLRQIAEQSRRALFQGQQQQQQADGNATDTPEDPDAPPRKRKRHQVDYRELYEQMKKEGFAG